MRIKDILDFDFPAYMAERFDHPDRTEGLHVSTIYGDLDRALNPGRYAGEFTEGDLGHFGTIGFLWERMLEDCLATITAASNPARYYRPGEQLVEGLLLTPDYGDLDWFGDGSCELGLEEWKVTWKSVKKWDEPLEKNFWRWKVQMMAYCYVLGVTRARMRVLFIVGNWRDSIVPVCKVREFEFTEQELRENWAMLLGHAKRKGWVK